MSSPLLLGGDIYQERYEICEELGRGKFGVVFQVKDREDGQFYAAKHIRTRRKEQREKVLEEINLLHKLNNSHIMRFVGAYEKPREVILVTEFFNGGELFERVVSEDFTLTESDCCSFLHQLSLGLSYLHSINIVHLDLKPENILCLDKFSTNIKIIDFGLARTVLPGEEVRIMCGTPEFVAPEIVSYDNISSGTDMWALGVISYILLSGYSPFMGDTDSETYINISRVRYDFEEPEFDSISQNAKDFISGLLQKSSKNRPSAEECLSHPWLLQQQISQSVINTNNLKKFLNKRRWRRCFQAIVAMKRLSLQETTKPSFDLSCQT